MVEIYSNAHEIEEVFLCYSLCHMLSDVSFHESNDKCDDDNENVKCDKKLDAKSNLSFPIHIPFMLHNLLQAKLLQMAML